MCMRDSNTDHNVLAEVLVELESVVHKGADGYSFFCPLEHRKGNASAEMCLDAHGRVGVCGRNRELWLGRL